MWIKTQRGELCNLDQATDVILVDDLNGENTHAVRVIQGKQEVTTVFNGSRDQCREVMNEIGLWVLPHELISITKYTKPE